MEDATANNASSGFQIPRYDQLRQSYDMKWLEEKEKFHAQLKENFQAMIFACICNTRRRPMWRTVRYF